MEKGKALKGFLQATLLAAFACAVSLPARADLIQNGTFTSGTYTFTSGYDEFAAPSNAISNWTVTNGSVDVISTYWQQSPAGGYSLDMDGVSPGTITQTVSTTIGANYVLTFYLSGNPDAQGQTYSGAAGPNPATKILDVSATPSDNVVGSPYDYTVDYGTNSESNMLWEQETFLFTATSDSTTISFSSGDPRGNPWGPALAGVDLEAAPEPGFYGVLAVGLVGLAFFSIRRRKRLQKV